MIFLRERTTPFREKLSFSPLTTLSPCKSTIGFIHLYRDFCRRGVGNITFGHKSRVPHKENRRELIHLRVNKFWNWKEPSGKDTSRVLSINGTIAEESWFDDDVTPMAFRQELFAGDGDITLWINSPGGDVVAAAQIYNMLMEYRGNITVKIDGLAASAASVIAMAGTEVYMSPVSMLMIHNPLTVAIGDSEEMQKAIDMLSEVKESIINAYERKTGLSRAKISHLMDAETWMSAGKAIELGFCDGMLYGDDTQHACGASLNGFAFSRRAVTNCLTDKLKARLVPKETEQHKCTNIVDLEKRLYLIK